MEWIRFDGVVRAFGAHDVLASASGVLRDREKIGLIGPNGSGKSTLLQILAGLEAPDGGSVVRARGARIGYVAQQAPADEATLGGVMRSAFAHVHAEEAALRRLESELADAAQRGDSAGERALLARYGAARDAFERHGGAGFERRIRSMLAAFGLFEDDIDKPMSALSGGQRTRASLARVLLEEPDCVLFDEPTNHLDVDATRFLEDLIVRDARAMIVVSHDRYVLDRVATCIWELRAGRVTAYPAPPGAPAYTAYLAAREERLRDEQRAYERAVAERRRSEAAIAELRTHGSHNYAQVRSREKMLDRLERPDAPRAAQRAIGVRLRSSRERARGLCLDVQALTKAYGSTLFEGLAFALARGERIAVVGPNGAGKSTLLKIVAGLETADAGTVSIAGGATTAYFAQDAADDLPAGVRAVDAVTSSGVRPEDARALLGRMGLGGELADKPVEAFSGGERRRIMLARLMARATDCLLLDEPTNDLDIASREALESALELYDGAMLVVSHDRYLLRRVADRVLELRDGRWTMYGDGYEAYEERVRGDRGASTPSRSEAKATPAADVDRPLVVLSKNKRIALERQLAELETEIERLDRRRDALEREYADPELYTDPRRVKDVREELERVRSSADDATRVWEQIVETLHDAAP